MKIDIQNLPDGWRICKVCGEKPVMPICENNLGFSVGIETVADPNPICEDCYSINPLSLVNEDELPF